MSFKHINPEPFFPFFQFLSFVQVVFYTTFLPPPISLLSHFARAGPLFPPPLLPQSFPDTVVISPPPLPWIITSPPPLWIRRSLFLVRIHIAWVFPLYFQGLGPGFSPVSVWRYQMFFSLFLPWPKMSRMPPFFPSSLLLQIWPLLVQKLEALQYSVRGDPSFFQKGCPFLFLVWDNVLSDHTQQLFFSLSVLPARLSCPFLLWSFFSFPLPSRITPPRISTLPQPSNCQPNPFFFFRHNTSGLFPFSSFGLQPHKFCWIPVSLVFLSRWWFPPFPLPCSAGFSLSPPPGKWCWFRNGDSHDYPLSSESHSTKIARSFSFSSCLLFCFRSKTPLFLFSPSPAEIVHPWSNWCVLSIFFALPLQAAASPFLCFPPPAYVAPAFLSLLPRKACPTPSALLSDFLLRIFCSNPLSFPFLTYFSSFLLPPLVVSPRFSGHWPCVFTHQYNRISVALPVFSPFQCGIVFLSFFFFQVPLRVSKYSPPPRKEGPCLSCLRDATPAPFKTASAVLSLSAECLQMPSPLFSENFLDPIQCSKRGKKVPHPFFCLWFEWRASHNRPSSFLPFWKTQISLRNIFSCL